MQIALLLKRGDLNPVEQELAMEKAKKLLESPGEIGVRRVKSEHR